MVYAVQVQRAVTGSTALAICGLAEMPQLSSAAPCAHAMATCIRALCMWQIPLLQTRNVLCSALQAAEQALTERWCADPEGGLHNFLSQGKLQTLQFGEIKFINHSVRVGHRTLRLDAPVWCGRMAAVVLHAAVQIDRNREALQQVPHYKLREGELCGLAGLQQGLQGFSPQAHAAQRQSGAPYLSLFLIRRACLQCPVLAYDIPQGMSCGM